jgi:hypothetical protein
VIGVRQAHLAREHGFQDVTIAKVASDSAQLTRRVAWYLILATLSFQPRHPEPAADPPFGRRTPLYYLIELVRGPPQRA